MSPSPVTWLKSPTASNNISFRKGRRVIESARNQGKVSIVAAVTSEGRAAIKRLLIDGKPVYDEPMF